MEQIQITEWLSPRQKTKTMHGLVNNNNWLKKEKDKLEKDDINTEIKSNKKNGIIKKALFRIEN